MNTKPSINWDEVPEHFNYMFIDPSPAYGHIVVLTAQNPVMKNYGVGGVSNWYWLGAYDRVTEENYPSYEPGTCDWKDSVVQRPEKDYE